MQSNDAFYQKKEKGNERKFTQIESHCSKTKKKQ
jgi:hypothetical protein